MLNGANLGGVKMALKLLRFFSTCSFVVLVLPGFALADWDEADELFERRSEGQEAIAEARAAYEAIAQNATGTELIRAVSQISKLDLFEGEMTLPKSAKAERMAIFKRCWETSVPRIHPDQVGETPNYYYWRGVCLGFWGEAAGPLRALPYVSLLLDLIEGGMEQDTRYEGGGIYRLAAGIYVDKQSQPLGLYDPDKALEMIELSLEQDAFPGDPNPGWMWYDNWRGKGLCLMELDRLEEAKDLLLEKREEIEILQEDEELPFGREPETLWNYRLMQDHLDTIEES